MDPGALVFALAVLVVILIVWACARIRHKDAFSGCHSCGGDGTSPPAVGDRPIRRGEWVGGRGPYNLQLYDAPHYYPYYESRDYMAAWDNTGRCAAFCSASEDGGCTVSCR